jgi:hypothetical protein
MSMLPTTIVLQAPLAWHVLSSSKIFFTCLLSKGSLLLKYGTSQG